MNLKIVIQIRTFRLFLYFRCFQGIRESSRDKNVISSVMKFYVEAQAYVFLLRSVLLGIPQIDKLTKHLL